MIEGSGSGSIPLTMNPDPDPGGPKTSGSNGSESRFGSGSGTLVEAYFYIVHLYLPVTRYLFTTRKQNSWTYNFVEFSGHNLESS
jgi:hypothetical protein